MSLTIMINSIVCVLGTHMGLLVIISIAHMTLPWRTWLLAAALLVPVMFVVSGFGAWLANAQGLTQVAIGLIAMPWLYAGVFILLMLVSFEG